MNILKVRRYGMGNEYAFRCLFVLAWRLRLRNGYFGWNTMFGFHSLHFVKGCVLIVDNGRTSFVWSVLKVEIMVVLTIFYIVYLLALCVAWRLGLRNGYFCWNIMFSFHSLHFVKGCVESLLTSADCGAGKLVSVLFKILTLLLAVSLLENFSLSTYMLHFLQLIRTNM